MDRIPTALWYLLLVIGYLLYQFLAQRVAQRRQRTAVTPPGETSQPEVATEPAQSAPAPEGFGRTLRKPAAPISEIEVPVRVRHAVAPPAPDAIVVEPRPRRAARTRLGSRRDLRRAVVLMAVLGPCRALEEHQRNRHTH